MTNRLVMLEQVDANL